MSRANTDTDKKREKSIYDKRRYERRKRIIYMKYVVDAALVPNRSPERNQNDDFTLR